MKNKKRIDELTQENVCLMKKLDDEKAETQKLMVELEKTPT